MEEDKEEDDNNNNNKEEMEEEDNDNALATAALTAPVAAIAIAALATLLPPLLPLLLPLPWLHLTLLLPLPSATPVSDTLVLDTALVLDKHLRQEGGRSWCFILRLTPMLDTVMLVSAAT